MQTAKDKKKMLMEKILSKTVGEIVAADFRTAKVFEKNGIDFCCGGNMQISKACRDKDVDSSDLARELEAVKAKISGHGVDYTAWDLSRLADHIINVHHTYLNSNLGTIAAYADKIAVVHGKNHPELKEIARIFLELSGDLLAHLSIEEVVLFPAVRRIESARTRGREPSSEDVKILKTAIQDLSVEHAEVGGGMHTIRRLSSNYAIPYDACNTFALTYKKLEEFENDLHKHVHLENNIFFPKASALLIAAA